MKSIRLFLLFLALMLIAGTSSYAQIQTFTWQNTERQYLLRMPEQQTGEVPVLFFLHGLGDNITRLDNEFHFQQIANEIGWALIVPQALSEGYGAMWNAGMTASTTDDAGFLMALVDALAVPNQMNLDSVFFTGFSMGGFMSHRMAIEYGDRIAGCAPVSGLITSYMANHTAVAPVRMLHIHGTNDPVVGYDGGSQYFGYQLGLSVDNIMNYWKNVNGCTDEPRIDTLPDLKNDGLLFVRYTYDCGTDLQHIKVIGGNHTFYLSEDDYDIGYVTEIVRFFKGEGSTTAVDDQEPNEGLKVYPNPSNGVFQIESEKASSAEVVDLLGRVVLSMDLVPGMNRVDLGHCPEGIYLLKNADGRNTKLVLHKLP